MFQQILDRLHSLIPCTYTYQVTPLTCSCTSVSQLIHCQTWKHPAGVLLTTVNGWVGQWIVSLFHHTPSRYDKNLETFSANHCPILVTILHMKICSAHFMYTLHSHIIISSRLHFLHHLRLQNGYSCNCVSRCISTCRTLKLCI